MPRTVAVLSCHGTWLRSRSSVTATTSAKGRPACPPPTGQFSPRRGNGHWPIAFFSSEPIWAAKASMVFWCWPSTNTRTFGSVPL
jgi:hypothetical protein